MATIKAVYTGTNPIQHDHGVLKANQGLVELEKGNFDKLKKLFPTTLKSADEVSADYLQVGAVQTGTTPANIDQGSTTEADEDEVGLTEAPKKKAGRPFKQ